MGDERGTRRLTRTRHHIDDAFGQARLKTDPGKAYRGERRFLRRLQDDGAARCKCRRDLPRGHVERKIPGRDRRNDAYGLLAGERLVGHAGRDGDGHVEGRALDLRRPARHVAEIFRRGLHLDQPGQHDRLALVQCLQLRQFLAMRLDQVGDLQEQPLALCGQHFRPRPLERLLRGGNRPVDIGRSAGRHARKHFSRRRIIDGKCLARLRGAGFSADHRKRRGQKGRDVGTDGFDKAVGPGYLHFVPLRFCEFYFSRDFAHKMQKENCRFSVFQCPGLPSASVRHSTKSKCARQLSVGLSTFSKGTMSDCFTPKTASETR